MVTVLAGGGRRFGEVTMSLRVLFPLPGHEREMLPRATGHQLSVSMNPTKPANVNQSSNAIRRASCRFACSSLASEPSAHQNSQPSPATFHRLQTRRVSHNSQRSVNTTPGPARPGTTLSSFRRRRAGRLRYVDCQTLGPRKMLGRHTLEWSVCSDRSWGSKTLRTARQLFVEAVSGDHLLPGRRS